MKENKTEDTVEAPVKALGKPWKTFKGCREVPVYTWKSCGRRFYRLPTPGAVKPYKTTSNKKAALDLAKTLAGVPAKLAPTISGVTPELLVKTAEAIQKLEPVLSPLDLSVLAGLEEYARLKARTGKLALGELFDGLLISGSSPVNGAPFADRLREISLAIAKLTPVLEPLKLSIASGIEEYAAVKAKAGAQDLRELFGQLLTKTWIEKSKTPIAKVLEEFLNARKTQAGVSFEYHKGLYFMLNYVVEHLKSGIAIGAVTTEMLKQIVFRPNVSLWSRRTYRTNVRTFFRWCQLHEYLDYSQPTAADRLERIKLPEPAPRILTVAEAAALLTAIEDPWCLLFLALSLFSGIRHDELQELTFDLIKPAKVVDITAEISKTGKRRLVPTQAVLHAWLAPFYGRSGLVMPIANIQAKVLKFLRETEAPNLPRNWGRNWLRQSYCSYRLAQTGKVLETAQED